MDDPDKRDRWRADSFCPAADADSRAFPSGSVWQRGIPELKRNVYLAQVNHTFGLGAFLPYSVGLLQAYAQTDQVIRSEYAFKELFFRREPIKDVVNRMENPDVLGLSFYIWNSSYSHALARAVRTAFPKCLIVAGGPHIPVKNDGFFDRYPSIDILVHYEGEAAFKEILLERLFDDPRYEMISGLTLCSESGVSVPTRRRERQSDLSKIPSPYLSGIFDQFMQTPEWEYHATQETHRGCPFSCQFCDWGSSVFTKVRRFPDDRLEEELAWFSRFKISLLYNADANFAMFDKDVVLTEKMVELKRRYGFPEKFRAAYAKNSNERVFEVSRLLNEAGMSKGTTLSFQSMNPKTLENVKRKNIRMDNFRELMRKYRSAGIPTYSELIVGLPGETYDTFADGIETLISNGAHEGLQVYTCELLPNSEMSEPAYVEKHGIKSVHTPVLFFHGTPPEEDESLREHYELVIGTNTLSPDDWLKTQMFAWAVQAFHCMGLTQIIAVFLNAYYGLSYRRFYEKFLGFAALKTDTVLHRAYKSALAGFVALREGREWGFTDSRFGDITWPLEEGAFLTCVAERDRFYGELFAWLIGTKEERWVGQAGVLRDLVCYQRARVKAPFQQYELVHLRHDIHRAVAAAYDDSVPRVNGTTFFLEKTNFVSVHADKVHSGLKEFAKEVVWFGRKGGSFVNSRVEVTGEE